MDDLIKSIIQNYLSYQDVDIPSERKLDILRGNFINASAQKYALSLAKLFELYTDRSIHLLAGALFSACEQKMLSLHASISPYGQSKSWVYWDIGKQFFYFENPSLSGQEYYISNPVADKQLQQQIVQRHLGWEIYHHWDRENLLRTFQYNTLLAECLSFSAASARA